MGRKMQNIEGVDSRLLALKVKCGGTWREVAKKLHMTERTVNRWAKTGIPPISESAVEDALSGKIVKRKRVGRR